MSLTTTSGVAEVNGARLHYDAAGAGFPLVLVHAGICDRRMWDGQMAAFAEHFRVIRYDLRGFGDSAMPLGPFSHLADLEGLLAALGVGRAHVLGCSRGGSLALDFALAHPEQVGGLVLVCSSPSGYEPAEPLPEPAQWPAVMAAFEAGDLERAAELEVQVWVDGPQRGPDVVDPAVRARVVAMDLRAMRHELASQGQEHEQKPPPAAGRLGEVRVPALVIIGDLDASISLSSGAALAAGIPGAKRVVIAGTAHLPNMEQPARFNEVVMEFLLTRGDGRH
jgi:3-oxoadipate enol-lactonase